jgi:hypothetical protein
MKITWIELEGEPHRIILVDGYLPSLKKLEEKLKNAGFLPEPSEVNRKHIDDLVGSFLGRNMESYHRKVEGNKKANFHNCDLFYSKVLPPQDLPNFFKNITPFYEEIEKEKHENYRQLILVYDTGLCQMGRGCMRNLIKKLEFDIKQHENYKNYPKFKEGILGLLDYAVLDPYEAPCILARERFKKIGFLAESGL